MKLLERFIEVAGITEQEALSALIAAIAPPQLGPLRQNWMRQPQFGNSAPETAVLRELFEDSDYRCTVCGSQLRLGLDHIDSNGSDHRAENLQVLCFSCNRAKGRGGGANVHHGRRLVVAVLELHEELSRFPTNREIMDRAGITNVGRVELMAYLRRRLKEREVLQTEMQTKEPA